MGRQLRGAFARRISLRLLLLVFLLIFGCSVAMLLQPAEQLRAYLQISATPFFAVMVACIAVAGCAQARSHEPAPRW